MDKKTKGKIGFVMIITPFVIALIGACVFLAEYNFWAGAGLLLGIIWVVLGGYFLTSSF